MTMEGKQTTMTPEEKFLLDLQGYILIKGVLSSAEVDAMNSTCELKYPANSTENGFRSNSVSQWGPAFQKLIDHPKITPYLNELMGPYFRLDHDYCIFMRDGCGGGNLHGGEGHEGDHWYKYRDGIIHNGLSVVTFFLSGASEGDGGFECIPGTHKSNFISSIPNDVANHRRSADYVVQPVVEAGDALFFTEALVHGTKSWSGKHERRALLYKYSPGHSAWSQTYYDTSMYPDLTDQQRRILQPPSVGSRQKVILG